MCIQRRIGIVSALAAFMAAGLGAWAQVPSNEGREFWLAFPKNFRDYVTDAQTSKQRPSEPLELALTITSRKQTQGYVEITAIGFRKTFTVTPGTPTHVIIDTATQIRSAGRVEKLGVHVVADAPIVVVGSDRRYQTTDTYTGIPVDALGQTYRAIGYRWLETDLLSQITIVATDDNTTVKIAPTAAVQNIDAVTDSDPSNVLTVRLGRGDVYQVMAKFDPSTSSDLTGTAVMADKPVAVFSGHNCAYVPNLKTKGCNILVEQLAPLNTWGTKFVVGAIAGRSYSVVRVVATMDKTAVMFGDSTAAMLSAGEHYENAHLTGNTTITTTQPAMVVQFSPGFDNGDNAGDPMMLLVPPVEQYATDYIFATPINGSWHHYINVAVSTATIDQLRLDDKAIDRTKFNVVGDGNYSVAQIKVTAGAHHITGSSPFGIYSYGLGFDNQSYDAYGNGGMQRYRDLYGSGK